MTVLHAPVGVRSIVSFLVAFFIVVACSIVFLFDRGQDAHVQMVVELAWTPRSADECGSWAPRTSDWRDN